MQIKRIWLFLAVTFFVSVFSVDVAYAYDLSVEEEEAILFEQGFSRWEWRKSSCHTCQLVIQTNQPEMRTEKVFLFLQALSVAKPDLLALYPAIHGEEYNLLAHMAVGILGRESAFFESNRYYVKESVPWAIKTAKVLKIFLSGGDSAPSPNSRGPTQIKIVPEKIAQKYGVKSETLSDPTNAALATMGYLLDALPELKRRAKNNHLDFINEATYIDYLPYIYFGATRSLLNKTATPEKNIYVKDMKKYMSWVRLYQRPLIRGEN